MPNALAALSRVVSTFTRGVLAFAADDDDDELVDDVCDLR